MHAVAASRQQRCVQAVRASRCVAMQLRSLRGLNLKASLEQFSATMTAQTDLRVESAHLRRFFRNFAAVRSAVTPPFPLPGFETASVLVETFEPGEPALGQCGSAPPLAFKVLIGAACSACERAIGCISGT